MTPPPTDARPLRGLVPAEIAIVVVIALFPLPEAFPLAIPLVVAASISKWVRGASWGDVGTANGFHALVGLGVGIAGLLLALIGGTPIVEALTSRAVEWSTNAVVRGNPGMLGGVLVLAAMMSLCMEAALRGWIVERVLELAPSQTVLAILVGGFAEAIVTPGDLTVRIGACVWGIGLGWIYVAAKRNLVVTIVARMTFVVVLVHPRRDACRVIRAPRREACRVTHAAFSLALSAFVLATPAIAAAPPDDFIAAAPACELERAYCFSIHLHVAEQAA